MAGRVADQTMRFLASTRGVLGLTAGGVPAVGVGHIQIKHSSGIVAATVAATCRRGANAINPAAAAAAAAGGVRGGNVGAVRHVGAASHHRGFAAAAGGGKDGDEDDDEDDSHPLNQNSIRRNWRGR